MDALFLLDRCRYQAPFKMVLMAVRYMDAITRHHLYNPNGLKRSWLYFWAHAWRSDSEFRRNEASVSAVDLYACVLFVTCPGSKVKGRHPRPSGYGLCGGEGICVLLCVGKGLCVLRAVCHPCGVFFCLHALPLFFHNPALGEVSLSRVSISSKNTATPFSFISKVDAKNVICRWLSLSR